ncbi:PE-PGRS family protein PE_PGRS26 [Folsomia candida]|uniref:PE-PGRS family protein PE_PGRS26 n=1 Tax=Folsomia candida TaxID=158441 RepID=UPI000B90642C|nr:PE-PGRS family protein PE_PGRS26 [Folsomia candida]
MWKTLTGLSGNSNAPKATFGCGGDGGFISSPGGTGRVDDSSGSGPPKITPGQNSGVGDGGDGGVFNSGGGTGYYEIKKNNLKE